jgi:hypothetical protein
MAMCNKKIHYELARYGNFHQQKLAKCTKHNLNMAMDLIYYIILSQCIV